MNRLERISNGFRRRPVLTLFALFGSLPIGLAAFSFRQPIAVPSPLLGFLEVLFRLLVYAPVAAVKSFLFEPLGLDVLFAIPGFEQAMVFTVLVGFYYGLSLGIVRVGSRVRARVETGRA
ncbi:hypothetical protein [Natronococcus wangiae]|uniref:hypothetical protein n=1 Tax=Natronococcus wangiae TaxID=3068275 RepID=UPI00273FF43C|nr:hypothetical protein [Natronococcus sp. AD5]